MTCPNCNLYLKARDPRGVFFGFCCGTCRYTPGTHGQSDHYLVKCIRPTCNYAKGQYDYCCRTCSLDRRNQGNHGHSPHVPYTSAPVKATQVPAGASASAPTPASSSVLIPCHQLYPLGTICFYEQGQPFYEFTNFFLAPFTAPRIINFNPIQESAETYNFPTSEHYFQAMKFAHIPGLVIFNSILANPAPRSAFTTGKAQANIASVVYGWGNPIPGVKFNLLGVPIDERPNIIVMRCALYYKLITNPAILATLKSTGSSMLVEHTINDRVWGDGGDGTGQNLLGRLLMHMRAYM